MNIAKKMSVIIVLLALLFTAGCTANGAENGGSDTAGEFLLYEKTEYERSGIFAEKKKTVYEYNENGLLTKILESDKSCVVFDYDEEGRKLSEKGYSADGAELYCYLTEYDAKGKPIKTQTVLGTEEWKYNNNGLVTEHYVYNEAGELTTGELYNEREMIIRRNDVSSGENTVFEYENGRIISENTYVTDGTPVRCRLTEYPDIMPSEKVIDERPLCEDYKKIFANLSCKLTYSGEDDGILHLEKAEFFNENKNPTEVTEYYENGQIRSACRYEWDENGNQLRRTASEYGTDGSRYSSDDIYITENGEINVDCGDGLATEIIYDSLGRRAGVRQKNAEGKLTADVITSRRTDYVEYKQILSGTGKNVTVSAYRVFAGGKKEVRIVYGADSKPECEYVYKK